MKILFLCPDYFFRDTYYEYRWIVKGLASYLLNDPLKELGIEIKIYCGKLLQSSIEENLPLAKQVFVKTSGKGVFDPEIMFEPYYWNIHDAEKIFYSNMDFNSTSFYAMRQKVVLDSTIKVFLLPILFIGEIMSRWHNGVPKRVFKVILLRWVS